MDDKLFNRADFPSSERDFGADVIELNILLSRSHADVLAKAAERTGCTPAQLLRKVILNLASV